LRRLGAAVAHAETVTVLVELAGVRRDVRGNLGLQGSGEHPPRALTNDLVDQRPAGRGGLPIRPGGRQGLHLPAPTDPDVSLSARPARVILFFRAWGPMPSGRTAEGAGW